MAQRAKLTVHEGRFVVRAPPHVSIKLRRVFGGVQRYKAGVFHIAATPANAFDLRWFSERHPIDVDDAARAEFGRLVELQERRNAAIAEFEDADYIPREFELALPPRPYQRLAADLALKSGALLVGDDLGVGKTATAICAVTAPGKLPALVVTPLHLMRQWEREFAKFAPKLRVHRLRKGTPYSFHDVKVEVGTDGRRRVVRGNPIPDVIIANYHKLAGWCDTLANMVRSVIFDEGHELRHAGTRKYEAATAIARECELRMSLTATPILNYGAEIYSVVDAIAPDQLGSRKEFFDEWCGGGSEMSLHDQRKTCVSDPAALGSYLRESGLMIRRTRKDVGRELPALTVVRHAVEADESRIEQAAADVAELARRVLERIGTNLERMQAAGELDYRLRQATGIAKAGAIADFIRLLVEAGEKVVVFLWHHEVHDLVSSALSRQGAEIPHEMFTGRESESQKDAARRAFIEGDAQVLLMSLRSGAGLDGLQGVCRTVIIGELDWSPGVHSQCIGRVHRDGQSEPVMAYYLVADEGSDPVIADVLGLKEAQARGIMNPDDAGDPQLVGRAEDHVRKLAEDVIRRRQEQKQARRTA